MVAYAQRARQEGTRAHWEQPNARHVSQARIQQSSGPQSHQHAFIVFQAPARLKGAQSALVMRATGGLHPALVMRATRGLMEAHARRASQASTRARRDLATAHRVSQESGKARQELAAAAIARQTRTHLWLALTSINAPATRAPRGLMERHALRVTQASTRARQEMVSA